MSDTTNADRKLAEELYKTIWDEARYPKPADGSVRKYEEAMPRVRALFAAPRQVSEADIIEGARHAFEEANSQPWEGATEAQRVAFIAASKANAKAWGIYTPPPPPTPGKRFSADYYASREANVDQLANRYDAATAKAIDALDRCRRFAAANCTVRLTVEECDAALADLRCEGSKP